MERIKEVLEKLEDRYGKRQCIQAMRETLKDLYKLGIRPKWHENFEDEFFVAVNRFIEKFPSVGEKFVIYSLIARMVKLP